jgi:hypothetical protein
MAKEEKVQTQTEFQKKILNLLIEKGFKNPTPDKVAIMTHNNRINASVNYDFMSTGIEFPKNDFSDQEVLDAGFKLWPTWHFYN